MTSTLMDTTTISKTVTEAFRDAFNSHPARETDPALALDSARESARELIPAGVYGDFDDSELRFTADDPDLDAESPMNANKEMTMTTLHVWGRGEAKIRAIRNADGADHEAMAVALTHVSPDPDDPMADLWAVTVCDVDESDLDSDPAVLGYSVVR